MTVRLPDGQYLGCSATYPRNFSNKLFTRYLADGQGYGNLRNANVVYHAPLAGNWAHVQVDTLATDAFATLSDADIDGLFATYAGADDLILDLRANNGGNENHAQKLAGRFVDQAVAYGQVRARQVGSAPYAFEPVVTKSLTPAAASVRFAKPVAVLIGQRCMSSAEWLTLMMRACPNAVLIGDRTRGASGGPIARTVPELNLEYAISTWIAYDETQQPFEDRGIPPAISVAPDRSYDDATGRDYVLEAALAYLEWRRTFGQRLPRMSGRSDFDGDGTLDVQEYLAGSDPTSPGAASGFDAADQHPHRRHGDRLRPLLLPPGATS